MKDNHELQSKSKYKFLRLYDRQDDDSLDGKTNGPTGHYCHEWCRLTALLEENHLSKKDRDILEKEIQEVAGFLNCLPYFKS